MNYTTDDLITIAKRENNTKRSFLLVNPLQGKHLHTSPTASFQLFYALAETVFSIQRYKEGPLLVIGFAETATAIGAALATASPVPSAYITTTRECVKNHTYLYFSEEHSHASQQKLDKTFLDTVLTDHTMILFAEDEVTTGKTIANAIAAITAAYPQFSLSFGIASLLNGMSTEREDAFRQRDILCHYLLKVPSYDYETILSQYDYDPALLKKAVPACYFPYSTYYLSDSPDPRQGVDSKQYEAQCEALSSQLMQHFFFSTSGQTKHILILGTEECMYPGLYFGRYLEAHTPHHIQFHATTRSPILASTSPAYPIHARYELPSFYEQGRTTYLYNVAPYDEVYVLTDAPASTNAMDCLSSLCLQMHCKKVNQIIWRNE